jgi:hypothetical protein
MQRTVACVLCFVKMRMRLRRISTEQRAKNEEPRTEGFIQASDTTLQ